MISLEVQIRTFAYMILLGNFLAFIFDIYRVIRSFGLLGDLITKIIDFSFCVLAGTMTFVVLLKSNVGDVRFYIFIGLAVGILLYNRLFSKFVIRYFRLILEKIIIFIKQILKLIQKLYNFIKRGLVAFKEKIAEFKI